MIGIEYSPYIEIDYGPLDPKVSLEPDFFTDFIPERRQEIVSEEAAFYHRITEPYSLDGALEKTWTSFSSYDGERIPLKLYRPKSPSAEGGEELLAPVIFFHGGGWKTCSVETHDYVPSYIAAHAHVLCVSVEYRLAPEHKFPQGLEDCYAACLWIAAHADELDVDAERLVLAGDSSGGNFAAVIAQLARERKDLALAGQVLIYPVTDPDNLVPHKRSVEVYGPMGGSETPSAFAREYLPSPEKDIWDVRYAPLLAQDLSRLAPALFIEAECDSLVDDGLYYAKRLADEGVPVHVEVYKGMPHAFILRTYEETFAALDLICSWLNTLT